MTPMALVIGIAGPLAEKIGRVAPVARLGATGVASPQEVTNLADRRLDEGEPSRWVEWIQLLVALPPR